MWCFVECQDNQNLHRINVIESRTDTAWGKTESILLALIGKCKLLLAMLANQWGEKGRSAATKQMPEDISTCPRKDTTSRTAAGINSYHLLKFIVVLTHSLRPVWVLHRPTDEFGGDVLTIATSFKSLMIAWIFAIPSGMQYCFWFILWVEMKVLGASV